MPSARPPAPAPICSAGCARRSRPAGPAVAYSYDVEDQLLQVQRGGATTSLSYDLGGRKLQMNDPDMGVWNYAYDALGNLTRQADARGQRICLYYDGLNRLTGKQYRTDDACPTSNPSLNVTYAYDDSTPTAGQYGRGYRTGMVDPSGSAAWRYDARGRVIDETKDCHRGGCLRLRLELQQRRSARFPVLPGVALTSGQVRA